MEDATVTQDGLYQQGRYPSIIDTDDLVFELGKQTVDRLNKEKLLDTILKKSKMFEDALREAIEAKTVAEKEVPELRDSNEQYIENNKRLDAALVEAREALNIQKAKEVRRIQDVIDEQKELADKSEAAISAPKAAEKKPSKKRSLKKLLKKK